MAAATTGATLNGYHSLPANEHLEVERPVFEAHGPAAIRYSLLVMALVFLPLSGFILARARATFRDYQEA